MAMTKTNDLNRFRINLSSISKNIKSLSKHVAENFSIMGNVKANAYGTDLSRIAQHLHSEGIDFFGVSQIDEAAVLRKLLPSSRIFIINICPWQIEEAVYLSLDIAIDDIEILRLLEKESKKHRVQSRIHLHVNTGMGRMGCSVQEAHPLAKMIANSEHLVLAGLMTHYASAESPTEDAFTREQYEKFLKVLKQLNSSGIYPERIHHANSSSAIRSPRKDGNLLRLGLSLYGITLSSVCEEAISLEAALHLESTIVNIKSLAAGENVGYGGSYTVSAKEQRIATLPMGYYHALQRHYSNKGYVLVHGKRAAIVGRICMDFSMIDISHIPEAQLGSRVLIFGKDLKGHELPIRTAAENWGTIPHELLPQINKCIPRIFETEKTH
jgi:alanine racemase